MAGGQTAMTSTGAEAMNESGQILMLDDEPCGYPDCCCVSAGLPSTYAVSDNVLAAACANKIISDLPAWDKTIALAGGPGDCDYVYDQTTSLDGYKMDIILQQDESVSGYCWFLAFSTITLGSNSNIWLGRKTGGSTGAGIFTRISGCDTTPTLTVS